MHLDLGVGFSYHWYPTFSWQSNSNLCLVKIRSVRVSYHYSSGTKLLLGVHIRPKSICPCPRGYCFIIEKNSGKRAELYIYPLCYCLSLHFHFVDKSVCCLSPSNLRFCFIWQKGPQKCLAPTSSSHFLHAVIMDKLSLVTYPGPKLLEGWCPSYLLLQIE